MVHRYSMHVPWRLYHETLFMVRGDSMRVPWKLCSIMHHGDSIMKTLCTHTRTSTYTYMHAVVRLTLLREHPL